jgi:hypothetical protein
MNVLQDNRHQYKGVDVSSHDIVPFSLGGTFYPLATVQNNQREPHDRLSKFHEMGKGDAAALSRSSRRPAAIDGALRRRCLCGKCHKEYAHPQGVTRHQQTRTNEICVGIVVCSDGVDPAR